MSIWYQPATLEEINQRSKDTLLEHLGIQFTELGDDFLCATMPVDHRTHQPMGFLHGGANLALAETIGSVASYLTLDHKKDYCVTIELNANHIRAVRSGIVTGTGKPIHLGRSTQIWEIKICDQVGKLISICRLTQQILDAGAFLQKK